MTEFDAQHLTDDVDAIRRCGERVVDDSHFPFRYHGELFIFTWHVRHALCQTGR